MKENSMNEKEKNAIEEFRKQLRLAINIDDVTTAIRNDNAKTILNLIEKLQKENEELKVYNNSITSQLEQMTTEKFKEGWIHQSELKDFIPVQKVKDKIEELKQKAISYGPFIDRDESFNIESKISILQELLEWRK